VSYDSTLGMGDRQMTHERVPAIVVGGHENAVSVARNLTRQGIRTVALNYDNEPVRFSRYAEYVHGCGSPEMWEGFLLGPRSEKLRGSVLLACSDEAISIIVSNHNALSKKFLVEEGDPKVRRVLLDKFSTYNLAREAGIPTVDYWQVRSREELDSTMPQLHFPIILKPLYSPNSGLLKSKATLIPDGSVLVRQVGDAARLGVGVVLMDYIPGGDDRLCSYHSYLDEHTNPLVHLTKRQPRRFPRHSGAQTYAVITWVPEAAELGLKFLRHLKLKGLGNIEFKWDERDGKLKIIEVNARFTGSDCLITKSGINLALIAYNRITGRPQPPVLNYKQPLVLWRPLEDVLAVWELRKRGELSASEWLRQLLRTDKFPFFEWRDPMPALFMLSCRAWQALQLLVRMGARRVMQWVEVGG
jgi:D-aspartate ligase